MPQSEGGATNCCVRSISGVKHCRVTHESWRRLQCWRSMVVISRVFRPGYTTHNISCSDALHSTYLWSILTRSVFQFFSVFIFRISVFLYRKIPRNTAIISEKYWKNPWKTALAKSDPYPYNIIHRCVPWLEYHDCNTYQSHIDIYIYGKKCKNRFKFRFVKNLWQSMLLRFFTAAAVEKG